MFYCVNVWRIAGLIVVGKQSFANGYVDVGHKDTNYKLFQVWRSTDDLPNSPNFPAAKHSSYVYGITVFYTMYET